MKYIVATKEKMTQIFTDEGQVLPVTILKADPMTVTQVKSLEKDGYDAVQFGYGKRHEKNVNKAQKPKGNFAGYKEYRVSDDSATEIKVGDIVDLSSFAEGDIVDITSTTKGKGFQGVVKRYNFSGGRRTHGNKHHERTPGSIGDKGSAKVKKGQRMPGRTGGDSVTIKKLKVVKVNKDSGEIFLSGSIPGRKGTLVEVKA